MSNEDARQDWTQGVAAIIYQTCTGCSARWYFHRTLCPGCGSGAVVHKTASGLGVVYARTLVMRPPRAELRDAAPYGILLVDAEEGFRMMGQGNAALAIGDGVRARFVTFDGRLIPYFERD